MSLQDQNKMLYILHKQDVGKKNIKIIMRDLHESGTFNDTDDYGDDWEDMEEEADWLFSNRDNTQRITALQDIKKRREEYDTMTHKSQYYSEQEQRVHDKRQELIEKGIIKPDKSFFDGDIEEVELSVEVRENITTRYGRTPLHEAIAMRDISLVKKYIHKKRYSQVSDNNGHTPMQMAFYENYQEALDLFEEVLAIKE